MKALVILASCLAAATLPAPALALGHAGGPHGVAPMRPGHHEHFGRALLGLGGFGLYTPEVVTAPSAIDVDELAPMVEIPSAGRCPTEAPVATRSTGPHIITIGHPPAAPANAPKVIYGTD